MERRTSLIGVYGGTFDPIHLGHIHLLTSLLNTGEFTKILVVPAKQNPLKTTPSLISNTMRLHLLQASIKELNNPNIEIWEGELKRSGASYTEETLLELTQQKLGDLVLIVGNEVFETFSKWKNPKRILSLANVAIVNRDNSPIDMHGMLKICGIVDGISRENGVLHSKNSRWIKTFKINALPFSSTKIRRNLINAYKKQYLDPAPPGIQRSVWLVIKENQLYAVK
ncbi:MAG: nicotinate (nicotinamide) nucleotide adenylyltransferase [Bdellovibrionales bacterium]|nr:nicotinate (nicotinamide) nucleotide adenylyltransferase [Bdellovibrionales bacterium]